MCLLYLSKIIDLHCDWRFGSPVAYYWNDWIVVEASGSAEVNMCGLLWEAKT